MNNYAIARVFSRIADLMELRGDNPFKIRAYRTAAQVMQDLTESLEVLAERGELRDIPGIGEAIEQKTRDILATGTTKLFEELKSEVPESLTELLHLPGFGPKKIHAAWRELGIRNLDELEAAARENRLRTLPGMGAKSEEKLLDSIAAYRRRRERTPIGVALPYAESLARHLAESNPFTDVQLTGAVRRRQDTVERIELLAGADQAAEALEQVAQLPDVDTVLERSETCMAYRNHQGARVTVQVVSPTRLDAEQVRYTGSAAHLAELEQYAKEQGRDLETVITEATTEAGVYEALHLPYIVPELREGRGEVAAARADTLPRLIEMKDIRGVLHAHSTWSDGSATISQMAAAARALGYAYHGNTDHSRALTVARGLDEERLRAQMREIDALNETFSDGFRVLKGIECDILVDGELDLPLELLRELDLVIGSVHSHQKLDEATMTARIVRAIETGAIDLLAHPTGRLLGMRDPYPVDMERVMDAALAHGVALEINAFPDRLDLNDELARRAAHRGLRISINTDAHRPEHLSYYRYGIAQARRAWLEPENVINTWPLEQLRQWLAQRRK